MRTSTPDELAAAGEALRARLGYVDVQGDSPAEQWAEVVEEAIAVLQASGWTVHPGPIRAESTGLALNPAALHTFIATRKLTTRQFAEKCGLEYDDLMAMIAWEDLNVPLALVQQMALVLDVRPETIAPSLSDRFEWDHEKHGWKGVR